MIRKLIISILASGSICLLPALGRPESFEHPHLWILFAVGIAAGLFQPSYNPFQGDASGRDRGTATQILCTVYLTQLFAMIEAVYFRYPASFHWDPAAAVGLGVLLTGLLLRSWAYLTLGRYFTWHVAVQDDQSVIRSGPFRFVRHPSYTGALLTYVFTGVFLHAWFAAVIAPVALYVAFRRRIRLEEELLCRTFGEEYEDYRREVGALVPRLIKPKT